MEDKKSLFMELFFGQNNLSIQRVMIQYLSDISQAAFITELLNCYADYQYGNEIKGIDESIDDKWVCIPDAKIIKNIGITQKQLQEIKTKLENKKIINIKDSIYYTVNTNLLYEDMENFMQDEDKYDSHPFDKKYVKVQ